MKRFFLTFLAAAMLATTGCGPWVGTPEGGGIDTTGLQAKLPELVGGAAKRLAGDSAVGRRYILKLEKDGDTLTFTGRIGKGVEDGPN